MDKEMIAGERAGEIAAPEPQAAPVAAPTFEVDRCEFVAVSSEDALVRVSGRWSVAPEDVELIVFGNGSVEAITPLPPGAELADDGLWIAAYLVRPSASTSKFALMTAAGAAAELPAPVYVAHGNPAAETKAEATEAANSETAATETELEGTLRAESAARSEAEERLLHALEDLADAQAVADQLRRRCDLSERALAEFRDKLVTTWGEAATLRELLDEREAAHERAKQRAREADTVVEELEARAAAGVAELESRREEMEQQCVRLQEELDRRAGSEEAANAAVAQVADLQAEAAEALARFEAARADTDRLRKELASAREAAETAAEIAAGTAQDLNAQRAKTEEATQDADFFSERLAKAERELAEARDALREAEVRSAASQVEKAEAEAEVEQLRTEVKTLTERLSAAEAESHESSEAAAQHEAASIGLEALGRELEGEIAELKANLAQTEASLAQAETQAGETESLREQLEKARQASAELATSEQQMRQELESLTRSDLGEKESRNPLKNSKVSSRAYRELADKLEAEQAARAQADEEATRLAEQLRELEGRLAEETQKAAAAAEQAAQTPAQATVEADLRHLLEVRQRELDSARAELAEQRARFVSVAGQVTAAGDEVSTDVAEPAASQPWSPVDDDLLARIARAKALAGQD